MPTLERWFPNSVQLPIQFPFTMDKNLNDDEKEKLNPPERLFHFTKQKILQLKSKANTEAGTNNISSLQALFTHLWRSVVRSNQFDPQEEVHYMVVTGDGGLGKGATKMNKMIASHSMEKLKNHYENWSKTPSFIRLGSVANSNSLVISSSPRFNVYGCDFGWGKPVALRSGDANKKNGKISVFPV
ncbi:putative quinate O-hydroxycinnamoyltransferase [Medicago truncatula]|uniref:Putative quinate O-hydroxycinnamoyltransferase n=1 Tax=Medicago truncatula TaxID=3880 RepID=A0A396HCC1_MEDTR|nr:putative quinate O-hydroxycinnamoyltransferase [Medicago truncatula]